MFIKVDRDGRVIGMFHEAYDGLIFADWEPDGSLMDDRCVYKYKYIDGEVVGRTKGEMDEDFAAMPAVRPSNSERISALEAQLAAYEAAYAQGVSEA